ncbi:hypothetical protein DCS_01146 [Drechmeria coniospora]|uniref:Uncharacterized protein n=1 Tax=Drechmeria coniospora TaxID=98403 RepID=A0A151GSL4_DRECN|nr:hypothetical protein DCS_01146 [Drechmeria coniospora]KYK60012.1 hypothetical protein DCS_01146 [Drechmeria coniospora]ODA78811.1 hypothetical protein RJ55_06195 [Drechmeria coniospora]
MYHQRRRSGNTSMTDVRRAVTVTDLSSKNRRPAASRKHTPVSGQKLGRSVRERERERQDSWADERESFPQYWSVPAPRSAVVVEPCVADTSLSHSSMTCEKQFIPHDEWFLYCSETCRRDDQQSSSASSHAATARLRDAAADLAPPPSGKTELKDIVPRASPSRPTSMHYGSSPPVDMEMKASSSVAHHTSALSALRSLHIGLPSPPSPTGASFWPFGRTMATSPSISCSRPSAPYLSSCDGGYNYNNNHNYKYGAYPYDMGPSAIDRPLPSRHPNIYSRPRSIELVMPIISR